MSSRGLSTEQFRQKLSRYSILSECQDCIVVIQQPKGLKEVSSSVIRERLLSGKICNDMLYLCVAELMQEHKLLKRFWKTIKYEYIYIIPVYLYDGEMWMPIDIIGVIAFVIKGLVFKSTDKL